VNTGSSLVTVIVPGFKIIADFDGLQYSIPTPGENAMKEFSIDTGRGGVGGIEAGHESPRLDRIRYQIRCQSPVQKSTQRTHKRPAKFIEVASRLLIKLELKKTWDAAKNCSHS